jgi:site-specific recombinase XerC
LTFSLERARLVSRLDGDQGNTLAAWCDKYETILEERKLSKGTLDTYRQRLKALREKHGSDLIGRITTRHIAEFLAQ